MAIARISSGYVCLACQDLGAVPLRRTLRASGGQWLRCGRAIDPRVDAGPYRTPFEFCDAEYLVD